MPDQTVVYGEPADRAEDAFRAEAGGVGDAGPSDNASPATSGTPRRWVIPMLAVLVLLLAAAAAALAVMWQRDAETTPDDVRNFLVAELPVVEQRARTLIELLVNYDATNLDDRAEDIRAMATGSFRDQYDQLIEQGLGRALEAASASSRGQVVSGPDVSFRSPSEAVALARVSQTTQSTANPSGQSFLYYWKITLVKTSEGGWFVDQLEVLSEEIA